MSILQALRKIREQKFEHEKMVPGADVGKYTSLLLRDYDSQHPCPNHNIPEFHKSSHFHSFRGGLRRELHLKLAKLPTIFPRFYDFQKLPLNLL